MNHSIVPRPWRTCSPCLRSALAMMGLAVALAAGAQTPPALEEFAWRAPLTLPQAGAGQSASVVRLDLPVEALAQMQMRAGDDVRVFNQAGDAVPLVRLGAAPTAPAPPVRTPSYRAYPLYAPSSAGRARDAVEIRLDQHGASTRAWVRLGASDAAAPAATAALPAVLLDLREERQVLQALALQVELPANVLVAFHLASSSDLRNWSPVEATGPLYRFDGVDAPTNLLLALRTPLAVQGRYLRLGWTVPGVQVQSVQGVVAATQEAPTRLRYSLPAGQAQARDSLSWQLPFSTPVQALALSASDDATLLPVRIQGRNDAAEPWRTLGSGVVYRLHQSDGVRSNGAFALGGVSVRQLRVVALPGQPLPVQGLQAALEFAPQRLVFLAQRPGPFTLAVGRSATPPAWGDASVLTSVVQAPLEGLGHASVGAPVLQRRALDAPVVPTALSWLPEGITLRTALLWLVLGLGVVILAGVAWALLRQLGKGPGVSGKTM